MGSDAAFVIDDTSALGRHAQALLAGAGLVQLRIEERAARARLLLVDAPRGELERALRAAPSRVVHVAQALRMPGDRQQESGMTEGLPASAMVRARTRPYLESLLPRLALALSSGRFLTAAATPKMAYVAHEDAAIMAAALLASDLRDPDLMHVTGPRAFSHCELCTVASELFSRRVEIEEISPERLSAELVHRGMNPEQAGLSAHGDQLLLTGDNLDPSPDGPRVTGMAALALPAFLQRVRDNLLAVARARRLPAEVQSRSGKPPCAPINAP